MENSSPAPVQPNVAYFSDGNILRDIGKLEGKVDALKERVDKHEKFVDELKEWKSKVIGGCVVASAVFSFVATWILK